MISNTWQENAETTISQLKTLLGKQKTTWHHFIPKQASRKRQ
ncbi:hypothetical protein [Bartonella queenslandensis]|nr:hypothetical protein [Bartonella queenslandensis]